MKRLTDEERAIRDKERKEYQRNWSKTEKGKASLKRSHQKYIATEKGKTARKRSYLKHRDERIDKMKKYNNESGRSEDYVNKLMDIQDQTLLLMFEDILERREIAEMEIKIKFKDIGGVQ